MEKLDEIGQGSVLFASHVLVVCGQARLQATAVRSDALNALSSHFGVYNRNSHAHPGSISFDFEIQSPVSGDENRKSQFLGVSLKKPKSRPFGLHSDISLHPAT